MAGSVDQYAKQYKKFEVERTRPARDLIAAISHPHPRLAIDIGCGPGNSTEILAAHFPDAKVVGLDNAPDMIAAARLRLPQLCFELGDLTHWDSATRYDIILANASLQWAPDHAALYPHLVSRLAPGGTLAAQTPDNLDEPAHRLLSEIAQRARWVGQLGGVKRTPREPAGWYYGILREHCSQLEVWRTTYYHPLEGGAEAVVDWFKGSALRPFLAGLAMEEQEEFLSEYTTEIRNAYPALTDGTILLPFPRLFVVAVR